MQVHVEDIKLQEDLSVEELKEETEELHDNLEGKDCERKQEVAILPGPICEIEMWIAARDNEVDANQQIVQVHVEDIKTQEDLCAHKLRFWRKKIEESNYKERAEEPGNKIEELQVRLKEKDSVMEQAVAMIRGSICEVYEMIAARDGEMDTNQQTMQLHVEDIKPQEDVCANKLIFWRKKNKGFDFKKRAEAAEKKIDELQGRLKEKDRVLEQAVAMNLGRICELDEMIEARNGEMDTNQQIVKVHVEEFKPQCDLCIEGLKKNFEQLQDNLERKDHERKQEVAIFPGPICELEKMIAARDGEMDAIQQTVQVHVEDIKTQEDLCAPKVKFWKKKNEGSDDKKRAEEHEKKTEELQDRLKEKDGVMEEAVAMNLGPICEDDEMIEARDGEMDTNQQTVKLHVENFKPLYDLCVEELKKKNENLQDHLEGKGRERKQEVVILPGPICELEKMIAARDGEMDAIQQTVQVHVEDIMPQEDSCVLQQR